MKSDQVFALENAGWPALLLNEDGSILRANQTAVKLFGTALEGAAPLLSAIWAADNGPAEKFIAHWERSPAPTVLLKLKVKGGIVSQFPVSICSFTRDGQKFLILQLSDALPAGDSAKPPAEAKVPDTVLAQKQKLDCALQLARTVSLDFNNALTSILGHTSLMLSKLEPNHPWRNSLMEVEKSAARAAEVANDLGTFSRQDKAPPTQAGGNLNAMLQRSSDILKTGSDKNIDWTLQLEKKLFTAKFDEAKLQQAFVKILENAVQALGANGRITVHTRNVELTEPAQDRDLRLAPGTYVCAEIGDNGCGIEPDVLPRIFEPFFTTKGRSHRGLGLALVYGIITNHGGGMAVSSHPGAGTSVRVYLPAERKVVREATVDSRELNGTQTILMVDDEDLLLTMGETVLTAYGYRVLTANSGQKALDLLSKQDRAVDLVITDLVMPGMSGRELAEQIQLVSPSTRILCTSGFVRPQANDGGDTVYLQKPFTSQNLLIKVKSALAE